MARQRLRANGIELAYDDLGEAGAPPAVLLHALGEAAEDWSDLAHRLVANGHRVLAFDLRGHADSEWAGRYSSQVMAHDVVAALDCLGVRAAVVVAHSLGGVVAFHPPRRAGGVRPGRSRLAGRPRLTLPRRIAGTGCR